MTAEGAPAGRPGVRALILDDNQLERDSLATVLESDELAVEPLAPTHDVRTTVARVLAAVAAHSADEATIVLLDYRLDDRLAEVDFRGGTVANAFKEHDPTIPVVLFTTDEKLHAWVETRPGVEGVFDWRLLKGDIATDRTGVRAQIVDLARGWKTLRGAVTDGAEVWELLAGVLGVGRPQLAAFADVELHPPKADVPGELALWLLRGPLRWSGPLVDPADARVLCGVTADDFERPELQEWLATAAYAGPFQAFGRRWWSAPLRNQVARLTDPSPADADERAAAISEDLGAELEAEGCSWCRQARTNRACDVCRRAVDAAHSLRLLTDPPPAWADSPVVCFRCVADGSADGRRLAPGNEDVADGLREGSIASPLDV
jgi:CheY-like chemotaxis protein